ncbi:uncharacterized protein LOC129590647 [Paramacrobiotus metropolitanus]|uniref:uncharacterized protein LOC129590647 n=1 Tax=Paramacrobiotus metropolitanus TaxID=2943436 RepID=UPI0024460BD7|nr:uncharacterized protein LOC129590647 [Paramacrobiotus metropolitanus]
MSRQILVLFLFYAFVQVTVQLTLTGSHCQLNDQTYYCEVATVADLFNASLLPKETAQLTLGNLFNKSYLENIPALPHYLHDIRNLYFETFIFNDTGIIQSFLINIRSTVVSLAFIYGQFLSLNAGMFQGFDRLEGLEVIRTGLAHIAPGSFDGTPVLKWLKLTDNQMPEFDLSILPATLQELGAESDNITTLKASSALNLPHLDTVYLGHNNFIALPDELIRFLQNVTTPISLYFEGMPLTANRDLCANQHLQSLLRVAHDRKHIVKVEYICGRHAEEFCGPNTLRPRVKADFHCQDCRATFFPDQFARAYDICLN